MLDYPKVALGEFLRPESDEVVLDAAESYRVAGIYSFGRGLFERPPVLGAKTSYKTLTRLHEGQFVISRLNGWEGALDIVDTALAGAHVSNEFPTLAIDCSLAEPRYLDHMCGWPELWKAFIPRGSMVRRKRVAVPQLLTVEVPLPSIEEQRRVADHLDGVRHASETVEARLRQADSASLIALLPRVVDALMGKVSQPSARVSDLADFVSDTVHPGNDPIPATEFVGLQHIEGHTGRCLGSDPITSMKGRKFRFRPGDVVYGYLRPYQNKVWVADRHGLCSVDQYVLRPRSGVSADLLAYALRGQRSLTTAIDLTHSLQLPRLRSGLLGAMKVAGIAATDQADLVRRLDIVRDRIVDLAAKRRHQQDLAAALVPAALNEAFGALK